jgi:hypothetical protein
VAAAVAFKVLAARLQAAPARLGRVTLAVRAITLLVAALPAEVEEGLALRVRQCQVPVAVLLLLAALGYRYSDRSTRVAAAAALTVIRQGYRMVVEAVAVEAAT